MSLDQYLCEKEKEYYPDEEIESSSEDEDINLSAELYDDILAVKKIVDLSSPLRSTDDYQPNSDLMDMYAKGDGFSLNNNLDLYEVIKLMKDILDRHLFVQDMTYVADTKDRSVTFTLSLNSDMVDIESDKIFLTGFYDYLVTMICQKFGREYFQMSYKIKFIDNKSIMEIIIKESSRREQHGLDIVK